MHYLAGLANCQSHGGRRPTSLTDHAATVRPRPLDSHVCPNEGRGGRHAAQALVC